MCPARDSPTCNLLLHQAQEMKKNKEPKEESYTGQKREKPVPRFQQNQTMASP
jgi:hypothetical protein